MAAQGTELPEEPQLSPGAGARCTWLIVLVPVGLIVLVLVMCWSEGGREGILPWTSPLLAAVCPWCPTYVNFGAVHRRAASVTPTSGRSLGLVPLGGRNAAVPGLVLHCLCPGRMGRMLPWCQALGLCQGIRSGPKCRSCEAAAPCVCPGVLGAVLR